jgi:hypothetical protein
MGLEREVARIEETNYRTGYIASERLSTARQEEGIVLPPHRQEAAHKKLKGPFGRGAAREPGIQECDRPANPGLRSGMAWPEELSR